MLTSEKKGANVVDTSSSEEDDKVTKRDLEHIETMVRSQGRWNRALEGHMMQHEWTQLLSLKVVKVGRLEGGAAAWHKAAEALVESLQSQEAVVACAKQATEIDVLCSSDKQKQLVLEWMKLQLAKTVRLREPGCSPNGQDLRRRWAVPSR